MSSKTVYVPTLVLKIQDLLDRCTAAGVTLTVPAGAFGYLLVFDDDTKAREFQARNDPQNQEPPLVLVKQRSRRKARRATPDGAS